MLFDITYRIFIVINYAWKFKKIIFNKTSTYLLPAFTGSWVYSSSWNCNFRISDNAFVYIVN